MDKPTILWYIWVVISWPSLYTIYDETLYIYIYYLLREEKFQYNIILLRYFRFKNIFLKIYNSSNRLLDSKNLIGCHSGKGKANPIPGAYVSYSKGLKAGFSKLGDSSPSFICGSGLCYYQLSWKMLQN